MYETDQYEGMLAETIVIGDKGGDMINAYFARPLGPGPYPAVVLVHHMPGWDEWYREATRRFAHHGYLSLNPDLYHRFGHGSPEDVAAKVRAAGGVADDRVLADLDFAIQYLHALPNCNGKVAIFGTCSGGRYAFLAACRLSGLDAAIDCWGGRVVMDESELNPTQPVAPIDYTADLSCPVLGLFGEDDHSPTLEQVAQHESALKEHGKRYEFHRYPDAGHGFFYYHRPNYRQAQAVDGWEKIFAFLERELG